MTVEQRFLASLTLIAASTALGYLARKRNWLDEHCARRLMTAVSVFGYPAVGFLAIWRAAPPPIAAWLPALGAVQTTLMALFALRIGRHLFADRAERGMVGFSCGIGNHGVTMAGFVVYLLYGERGLGLSTVYAMYTFFAFVLLSYTIAQTHAPTARKIGLGELMLGNLLHWRAAGLYTCLAAIALTAWRVPVPPFVARWRLLDIVIHAVIVGAYFSIGLRLHFRSARGLGRAVLVTLGVRHLVGPLIGLFLVGLTRLTPYPLEGLALRIFLIQSSVSVGVMGVAVANMFFIKPKEASLLFVVSSAFYLAVGIPLALWIFGGSAL